MWLLWKISKIPRTLSCLTWPCFSDEYQPQTAQNTHDRLMDNYEVSKGDRGNNATADGSTYKMSQNQLVSGPHSTVAVGADIEALTKPLKIS